MDIDPQRLKRAKDILRRTAIPATMSYRGIPVEAFDREDLLLILDVAINAMETERGIADRWMGGYRAMAKRTMGT